MAGWIRTMLQALAARQTGWRRARNLRSAGRATLGTQRRPRAPGAVFWIGAAGFVFTGAGAALIAGHARHLSESAGQAMHPVPAALSQAGAEAFQPALPGAAFVVPVRPGISLAPAPGGALLVLSGMQAAPPLRIDLCSQLPDRARPRLSPLRIGYHFDDVARWVARNQAAASPVALRNIALAAPDTADMPQVQVSGNAAADFMEAGSEALQLAWTGRDSGVRWLGDASFGRIEQGGQGQVALRREGWLAWGDGKALRIQRRPSAACPQAGQLLLQMYKAGDSSIGKSLVMAFPARGQPLAAWLGAGSYQVPAGPRASLEDQALFQELQAHKLIRLGASGLAELAPRDLAAWQAAPPSARAAELAPWSGLKLDAPALKLIKRVYRMADGDYVRQQIDVFNGERRLLAWRVQPAGPQGDWQASVASVPVTTSAAMPGTAARLFAELPQGWSPWERIAHWPQLDTRAPARLTLALGRPAAVGESMQLMLVGQVVHVEGARLRSQPQGVCSGRACPARDAVQQLTLDLLPGARSVTIEANALELSALAGSSDQQYRHLRVSGGRLEWQPLAPANTAPRRPAAAEVTLADRNGTVIWTAGAPTAAAIDAGLAPLLGIRTEHANSVAGMLARLPAAGGPAHSARLSLDLGLQAASQHALECIGMRRGQWDGRRCSGGQPAPGGRHAGLVVVDTETGDVLAAAGAGAGPVSAANWSEVRDFDRANPARSPLRLPAFQHDGGAHQSPGSTFKVISALGLELAAQRDPQMEALLSGMPLAAINRMAHQRGFAFRTDAAGYPFDTSLAHITNYRDQHLDRRAQDGRFGLAQALTYSLNTWFAWSGELSDRSLFGRADGGAPDLQPLDANALDTVRPIVGMAHRLGFEQALRLDGGLLPADYSWSDWDALQASAAHIDPIHTRHELRQMSIGLRMQVTPLQMALAAGAVGQGRIIAPRLLLSLDQRASVVPAMAAVGVRLDRIRAGMKGVVERGTASVAFRGVHLDRLRQGLSGKTGTSPTIVQLPDGSRRELATVWFTGWLEPGSLPGQTHRLAFSAFVSHSEASGGDHAAPIIAAVLASLTSSSPEQKGK